MSLQINYRVEGLERIQAKAKDNVLFGPPMRHFFTAGAIAVRAEARKLAPADTGLLRGSIAYEIDAKALPLYARIGPNVTYGAYMEFGTGLLTDFAGAPRRRHWPPGGALDRWASKHGFKSGAQVAAIIGRRGGLRPRRYMRDGLEKAIPAIRRALEDAAREIGRIWERR